MWQAYTYGEFKYKYAKCGGTIAMPKHKREGARCVKNDS